MTPIKKQSEQKELSPKDKKDSNAVSRMRQPIQHPSLLQIRPHAISRMRQPIEALFVWLNKVTGIEDSSNVRSSKGLLTHIYGSLVAAMMLRSCPELGF